MAKKAISKTQSLSRGPRRCARSNQSFRRRLQSRTGNERPYYSKIHGMPPAEADFRRFFRVTPPVVHQMIKTLHARGFIDREPGKARTIRLRLTRAELPDLD